MHDHSDCPDRLVDLVDFDSSVVGGIGKCIEHKITENKLVVPKWLYDQMAAYGRVEDLFNGTPYQHGKNQIDPAKLNYPWRGHPV